MVQNLSDLDLTKTYSYADYYSLKFPERVELIRGLVYVRDQTTYTIHQKISGRILCSFADYLKTGKCKVYHAPFDVRFPKKKENLDDKDVFTVVQPDLCVICDESKLDERGCIGAPDLIIEILSSSNSRHDLVTKKKLYEENGVLEYWIVYPYEKVIMKYVLQNEKYVLESEYTEEDIIQTAILPGFELKMDDIFYE